MPSPLNISFIRRASAGTFFSRAMPRLLAIALFMLNISCGAKTGLPTPEDNIVTDSGTPDLVDAARPNACIEVPIDGSPIDVDLNVDAEVGRADVVFLIDTTSSMQDEIQRIRDTLRDVLVPGIRQQIPDANFSVATFADFPVDSYGAPEDRPFEMLLPLTSDIVEVQGAVNSISLSDGADAPESQVEALYQLATGAGLGSFVPPNAGCPRGGRGFACLRNDALPVVLLFTDDEFHNGPGGSNPYVGISPTPHTYLDTVLELRALDAHVIGFDSGGGAARPNLERIALDTNALDASRDPLVYDIGQRGERLSDGVISAIRTFAGTVLFDIDAVASDPDPGDGFDATSFVDAIEALSAAPEDGVERIDADTQTFIQVQPGTNLKFRIRVKADAVVPGATARRFRLRITYRGNKQTRIGSETIELVIPGADGSGCENFS